MVGFYYDDYGIDNGLESVSENTRNRVFERDGKRCWLCEDSYPKRLPTHLTKIIYSLFAQVAIDHTVQDLFRIGF